MENKEEKSFNNPDVEIPKGLTVEEAARYYTENFDFNISYMGSIKDAFKAGYDHAQQSKDKYTQVKYDADIMFNALFDIVSDETIDNLGKCMTVALEAINNLIDKTRNDTPKK